MHEWYGLLREKNVGIKKLYEVLLTYIMHDIQLIELIITPPPLERSSGVFRNHSVYPSVCVDSYPSRNFLFWFDIGLPYLAHGCITMRRCVAYIYDPNATLTFDLKVKFIGFMTWLCVKATAFLPFGILVILCLERECITIVWCVAYLHDICMTLTFDLKINIIFSPWIWVWQDSLLLDIGKLNLGIWVYHHETNFMYTFDLWPVCGWQEISLVSISHIFYLVCLDLLGHILEKLFKAFYIKNKCTSEMNHESFLVGFFFVNVSKHSLFLVNMLIFFLPVYNYRGRPSISGSQILKGHIRVTIYSPT